MPRTAAGIALTAQHREGQLRIRARSLRDFMRLWPLWTGDDRSFNGLVAATVPLVGGYYRLSSSFAADYYQAFRRAEKVGGSAIPRLGTLDNEAVVAGLYVTGRIMTRKALAAGQSPGVAMQTALVRVSGNVTRHVLAGGRDTVMLSTAEDKLARGWERVTGGSPCDFCASLAGVVNGEGGGFEAHDHCSCAASPTF